MNTKVTLFGLTITSIVTLMVSCSGSTDSNDSSGGSPSGGSSTTAGKAGASSAGTNNNSSGSSSGGNGNGTGGTANNNGGTRPMGGANNNGGFTFGGNFNFGGAGPDPSDFMCNPVPTAGSACTPGTQPCLNGDTNVCYCSMSKWVCMDVGGGAGGAGAGGQIECPATKPMSGVDCGDVAGLCPYGQNMGCACYNGKWACL
jgi:hypothetical protein